MARPISQIYHSKKVWLHAHIDVADLVGQVDVMELVANPIGKTAVVVGSSMAGLLAARALSQFFERVIVLERDTDPLASDQSYAPRKGVPQGRHIHILLAGGEAAINRFFPGIDQELLSEGAIAADFARDIRWYLNGRWFPRFVSGLTFFLQTRPLLEAKVRKRVEAIDNVTIEYGARASGYRLTPSKKQVDGVSVQYADGTEMTIEADFVVDAAGRGSHLPSWLNKNGFRAPAESMVGIDLAYATAYFKRPEHVVRDWVLTAHYPNPPKELRGGVISCVEGGLWQATLYGYHGDHPPTDEQGFKEFAATLPKPQIYETIKELELEGGISKHRFPASLRRHYERLHRWPAGLIAVGDAISSLNPAFGQGMTICALEARALEDNLARVAQGHRSLKSLPRQHFRSIAKIVDLPWEFTNGENFKYPQTKGTRPLLNGVNRWYRDRILMSNDLGVINEFYRVMHFVDPQWKLMEPMTAGRILRPKAAAMDSLSAPAHIA